MTARNFALVMGIIFVVIGIAASSRDWSNR